MAKDTLIILFMMGVFYAVVIYILYATLQTKNPDFDEYSVGGFLDKELRRFRRSRSRATVVFKPL